MQRKNLRDGLIKNEELKPVLKELAESIKSQEPITGTKIQTILKQITDLSKAGDWTIVAEAQALLKELYVQQEKTDWENTQKKFEDEHGYPLTNPFNLEGRNVKWQLDAQMVSDFNLDFLFGPDMYEGLSQFATAGVRHLLNVLEEASHDPTKLYSDAFIAVHAKAMAKFFKDDLYPPIQKAFQEHTAEEIREFLGEKTVSIVETLFNKNFNDVYALLKEKPLMIVAGETRPHTARWVEIQSRIAAAEDISILTTDKFSTSAAVNIVSLLTQVLGGVGGSMWTSSHSSKSTGGDKVFGPNGGQILAELYVNLVKYCKEYLEEAKAGKLEIALADKDDKNIYQTLNYKTSAKFLANYLQIPAPIVASINQALKNNLHVVVNCLNGAGYNAFTNYLREIGISEENINKIKFINTSEKEPQTGYVIDKNKSGVYRIMHDGTDMTRSKSLYTVPYHKILSELPLGTVVIELDNDVDRCTCGQKVSAQSLKDYKERGIDAMDLKDGSILARYSPNKEFLMLDQIDFVQEIKPLLDEEETLVVHLHTVVSGDSWKEFDDDIVREYGDLFVPAYCRVGYKNLKAVLDEIDDWFYNRPEEETFELIDQAGVKRTLNRKKNLRILMMGEESGGRCKGWPTSLKTILMNKTSASPEKSAIDSAMGLLIHLSRQYLADDYQQDSPGMDLFNFLKNTHQVHNIKSIVDSRADVRLTTTDEIGKLQNDPVLYAQAKHKFDLVRDNQCNFWLSLAKYAQQSGDFAKVKTILKQLMPELSSLWDKMTLSLYMEEPLPGDKMRPEGAYFKFETGDIITAYKFRASATDITYGLKYYSDSDGKTPLKQIDEQIIKYMSEKIIRMNLHNILRQNNIPTVYELLEEDIAILEEALAETELH